MDRICPTSVSALNLTLLNASEETELAAHHNYTFEFLKGKRANGSLSNESFAVICAEPRLIRTTNATNHSPWSGVTGQVPHVFLHNGPSPVWIDELQVFLGIGHLARGERNHATSLPDPYIHQFFALAPDFQNDSQDDSQVAQGQQTFRLISASPEFCFSSVQAPLDCENIQFASTLVRDGSSLLVGYGIEDCDSFIQRFALDQVLHSLRNLDL